MGRDGYILIGALAFLLLFVAWDCGRPRLAREWWRARQRAKHEARVAAIIREERLRVNDEFEMPDGSILWTHKAEVCANDPACVIHDPSDHHMRDFPLHWRDDRGLMERICPHGVGHPDPDGLAFHLEAGRDYMGVHGCDGCCSAIHHAVEQMLAEAAAMPLDTEVLAGRP